MEPKTWDDFTEDSAPQGISMQDSVISGDVVHNTVISTGLSNQYITLQAPSSAPKVIGILCIIWAGFTLLGTLFSLAMIGELGDPESKAYIPEYNWYKEIAYLDSFTTLVYGVAVLIGSILLLQKKRLGIFVIFGAIAFDSLKIIVLAMTYPDYVAGVSGGFNAQINAVISLVCSLVCGLIVAIPLMISNNGLDDSKLFG